MGSLSENLTSGVKGFIDNPVGTVVNSITENPVGTAVTLGSTLMNVSNPYSMIYSGIGRGIDSYNSSVQSDKDLQATGVQATGPMGQDWTTSAIRDFVPGFLGGRSSEDQAKDIAEEVSELQNDWFDLDNIDAGGALDRSIMGNNSNYGSRTNLDLPDQAHRSLSPTNTAINQFYDRDTKEYVNMLNGERSPDWDGNQVIDSYNQASQRMRTAPIYTQGLAPPPGARSQWRNPNNPPPLNLNIAQSQIDADAATANAYAADQAAMAAATDAANAAAWGNYDAGGGSGAGGEGTGDGNDGGDWGWDW